MNAKLIGTAVITVLVAVGCGKKEAPEAASRDDEKADARTETECVQSIIGNMVEIPGKNFKMGKFEVTQRQWVAVMGDNPSKFKGDDNPVEQVSWDDCQKFLEKLNALPEVKKSGWTYRLPTEREWVYACRAGSTGDYCKLANGTEITKATLGEVAWYADNSNDKTHPVGLNKPNAWGLYDMYGNVREWCEKGDKEARPRRAAPGGGWDNGSGKCLTYERSYHSPDYRNHDLGFRLAAKEMTWEESTRKAEASARKTEEAARRERAVKEVIPRLIRDMIAIRDNRFMIGKYEVTQAQWEAVMGENPSEFKGADNPVENVSWDDCQEFLKILNAFPSVKESGLVFRLPTEEEWEYACRAGSTGDYCNLANGTEITKSTLGTVAWYDDNSEETTHPVGQKKPNAFGLYDMHGNVWEWCEDFRAGSSRRVYRGGSWDDYFGDCSADDREDTEYPDGDNNLGFRLAAEKMSAEEAARKAEEAARRERAVKEVIPRLIRDMIAIRDNRFMIGKYEVTQAQWEAVMGENPSEFKGADNPVENVSWDDCQEFLKELNALSAVEESGLVFRLPTEREWEYACRAGSTGDYCKLANGMEITESTLGKVVWYRDNSDKMTHPVGQKKPNAFGLYDMHGNVWEWCEGFRAGVSRRVVRAGASRRVVRGGGWRSDSKRCAAGNRSNSDGPGDHGDFLGFRLAASKH